MVGYDGNFVKPLECHHQCPVCKLALREPFQTECGHRLCKECYEDLEARSGKLGIICPVDQSIILTSQVFPDTYAKREVLDLQTYCVYRDNGCKWEGAIREFEAHITSCVYEDILCPAECGERVPRYQLDKHLDETCARREVDCQYCKMQVAVGNLQGHYDACEYLPVDCKFNCGAEKVPRILLHEHYEKFCPNAESACQFSFCGCMFRGKKEVMEKHLRKETHHHLKLAAHHASQMDATNSELQRKMGQWATKAGLLEQQVVVQGKEIDALKKDHIDLQSRFNAAAADISTLRRRNQETEGHQDFLERESGKSVALNVEFLRDQARRIQQKTDMLRQEASEAVVKVPETSKSGHEGPSKSDVEDTSKRMEKLESQLAIQDVQIAELNLKLQLLESTSFDGKLLWKIDNYTRRMQDAITGKTPSLYSPPFYTSRFGYKMCARIYLNGDGQGKGSHISLFFVVMRGEYDAMLDWPFPCKITMKLLSQEGNAHPTEAFRPDAASSSFRRPKSDMNIASGVPLFVSHRKIANEVYIKNNCIFIQIIVDTSTLRTPFS